MALFTIIGATGNVGGTAARYLLGKAARVRAVVRSADKAPAWERRGAEAAGAALDDPAALEAAFAGVDGVFVMTPTWFEAEDMFAENTRALGAIGQALRATRPAKVVLLSSIGAHRSSGTGAILKLHALEQAFADMPAVTSVRASWFMDNFAGLIPQARESGVLASMLAPRDLKVPMVATKDVGETVAKTLLEDWSGPRIVELEGPRRYSPAEVAEAFTDALGRDVRAAVLPRVEWPATYRSWGLTPRSVQAMSEMLDGFNSGWIAFEAAETDTVHGRTPLEDVLSALAGR